MKRALVVACAALAACAGTEEKSDWERTHESQLVPAEEPVVYPALPRDSDLIEFEAGAPRGREVRFFIDGRSIEIGRDSVVRYTLVVRGKSGAGNVSYEGIRCSTREVRVFALGSGKDWVVAKSGWRAIQSSARDSWHYHLYRDYFCALREPVPDQRAAIESLRRKPPTEYGL